MNAVKSNDNKRLDELKEIIKKKKTDNIELRLQEKKLKEQTFRYREIFNKSYLSIWEEDPSEVYKIMESLPCKNGRELSEFLSGNTETLVQMISQLSVIEINSYTVLLFGSSNKTEFLDVLAGGSILTQETFPGFIEIFSAMMDKRSNCQAEVSLNAIDGEKLNLLMTAYLPGKDKGNILISMMDISKRKNKEEAVSNSILRVNEQSKRADIIQNTLLSLTSSLNREQILNSILIEVKKLIPYSCANIRLLDNQYLKVAADNGYGNYNAEDFIRNSTLKVEELGDTNVFLETGKISIIPDTRNYSGWTTFPETSYIRAYIGVPIKFMDKPVGLLSLESDTAGTFTEGDKKLLEPFAHAAAVALQSSYLFELINDELEKRTQTETSLKKSLSEKEILLKEIHHRVKNNLTLIMSLINLQSNMISSDINPFIFEDLNQKIYTISLVHERLYNSKNLSSIDLKSYLIDLTSSIRSFSLFKEGIQFQINMADGIEIASETLIPLALMLNELIINSVKYAFPDKPGVISISVNSKNSQFEIIVRDDGIGLSENRSESPNHLGFDLIESLAAQIGGTLSFKNENGSVTTIIFPGDIRSNI